MVGLATTVTGIECATPLEAAVRELHRAGFLGAPEGTEVTSRVFQVVREPQP
jgi:hypothetical protein